MRALLLASLALVSLVGLPVALASAVTLVAETAKQAGVKVRRERRAGPWAA